MVRDATSARPLAARSEGTCSTPRDGVLDGDSCCLGWRLPRSRHHQLQHRDPGCARARRMPPAPPRAPGTGTATTPGTGTAPASTPSPGAAPSATRPFIEPVLGANAITLGWKPSFAFPADQPVLAPSLRVGVLRPNLFADLRLGFSTALAPLDDFRGSPPSRSTPRWARAPIASVTTASAARRGWAVACCWATGRPPRTT